MEPKQLPASCQKPRTLSLPGPSRTAGRRSRSAPTRETPNGRRTRSPNIRRVASRLAPKVQTPTLPVYYHSNLAAGAGGLAEPRPLPASPLPTPGIPRDVAISHPPAVRSRRSSSPRPSPMTETVTPLVPPPPAPSS
ncbi:hypothetical protein BDA96_04G204500 [Sorghum bicolor]|uniref:Uncharacterized protein n=2 Tax=Sorghum bicolor TaxID=4558 RepID=A0A921R5P1_SORBI|nr:hypothetical protein BDA96_04G204500 [Sorghum bicolor]KXG30498.1 hypothetical protein SORBI_3004G192300 [Sorghum bicolor]